MQSFIFCGLTFFIAEFLPGFTAALLTEISALGVRIA